MSLSKVVKSNQCYLLSKKSTDNMHICLNLIFKKTYKKMVAISSEIVHLLKVKLSLQNDQKWLLLLSWYSNFFRGRTPEPPFRLENM